MKKLILPRALFLSSLSISQDTLSKSPRYGGKWEFPNVNMAGAGPVAGVRRIH